MRRWFEELLRKSGFADEDPHLLCIAGLSAAAILAVAVAAATPEHTLEPPALSAPV